LHPANARDSCIFIRNTHPAILMQLTLLKSKLHRATVSGACVDYEGSMTISADLAERVGLLPYERILVSNMANGARFETYVIYGPRGIGAIELNGATAHLGNVGDRLTIMGFGAFTPEEAVNHSPRVAVLDEQNEVVRYHAGVVSRFEQATTK
jgi:aspartate 1-decarboxylase